MAKPWRRANVKLLGVVRRRRPALMVSTALCATVTMVVSLQAVAQPAPNARPTGGVVVGGSASISNTANQTTINQSTQRGAIDWQGFNVGSQQRVQFNQPSSSSMTLNRVVGPNPSQIAGRINANGQIIIENQSGVVFYKGSQVNTAGLMVTASSSSNTAVQTFINGGQLALDLAAHPNAAVVNQGQITVREAGLAALVAPQVANSGVITARLGTVVLAGGATKAILDLYGDGLLSIDVTGHVVQAPNGAMALVTNTGLIVADGGTVRLTATAADGLVQNLVNAGGKIQANSVAGHAGTVTLNAIGGSVTVVGQLDAEGTAPGTTGGSIGVNATGNVSVASTAQINASGQAGGGLVAIGTTLKRAAGGPSVTATHTAANVTVQQGATIAASATKNGNGGHVTVLSAGTTHMDGAILATGGPLGGNGGFVETSGHYLGVGAGATVDVGARAAGGTNGTWLLDPFDVDITSADNNTGSTPPAGGSTTYTASGEAATIANTTLETSLASDNVVVSTTGAGTLDQGNITVSAGVTWSANTTLTLQADNNILINAAISGTGATSGLTLSAGNNALTPTGSITISAPVSVNTFGATAGPTGTINLNDGTGTVVTTSGGGQTYNSPVVLQATSSLSDTGNGTISFSKTVDGAFGLTANAGSKGAVSFGGAVGGGTPLTSLAVTGATTLHGNVSTNGPQTYNSAVAMAAATVTLNSNVNGTANGAIDFVSTVDGTTAGGQGVIVNAGTGIVTFGGTVGGSFALASLAVTGPTTLDGDVSTDGPQTFNSTVTLGAATVTLNSNFNTTANGAIDFLAPISGGTDALTLTSGSGNQTLAGITSGGLTQTTTGTTTLNTGTYDINSPSSYGFLDVTTNGTLTFGQPTSFGAMTLGSDTTINITNQTLEFFTVNGVAAGAQSLTVNATGSSASVLFTGAVGGSQALASLAVTGATTLDANVSTEGAQTYNSPVTLGAATITLNSDANTTGNGAIVFDGQISGGTDSVALTSGSGNQTLSGITTSGSLTQTTTGTVTLDTGTYTIGTTTTAFTTPVTTNGTLTLGQATKFDVVTLGSDTTIDSTNTAIDFTKTVDATTAGAQGLVVNAGATGAVTFGGAVGGLQALASLAVTGPTTLGGDVSTDGAQTYNSAVTLNAATVALNSNFNGTSNGAVEFVSTVDGTTAGGQVLTVTAGTGVVTFGDAVGGSKELASLAVTGATTLDGNVSTDGAQTYNSAVTLNAATVTLNSNFNGTANGAVDFASTVDGTTAGGQGLTVTAGTGAVTFGDAVGGSKELASLAVTGPTTLDNNVSTDGAQTYNSAVTLNAATVTLNSNFNGTANGAVDFASTVDGTTAGGQVLTVTAGTGVVTFGDAVGGSKELASLAVTGATTLDGNVSTDGAQTFNSAVTLGAATVTLNSNLNGTANGAVDFASTVDGTTAGGQGLTVTAGTGAVTFGSAVGGSKELASLAVTGPTTLDGNVSTDGAQTYNSAVTLNAASVTLNSNVNATANGAVDFASTVDGTTAGGQGMTVMAGTGAVTFGSVVGGSKELASLAVTGPTTLDGNVSTDGAQTYNSGVTLKAATVTLNSNVNGTANGAIDFVNTVDATAAGGQGLIVDAGTGAVTFTKAVGGSFALASLAVTGPTALDANVSTQGTQTYNSPVTLGGATVTLNSNANATGNGAIDFGGQITGAADSLVLTSGSGNQTLSGITTTGNLTQSTSGTITLDTGTYTVGTTTTAFTTPVTTNGTVTLGQATNFDVVTLGSDTTIDSTNTAIDFTKTVDATTAGSQGLVVNAGATGAVTFGGAVGGGAALASLAVTGPTTLGAGGATETVATEGAQTYNSAVTLDAVTVTLNSNANTTGNGAVDFASTVNATAAGSQGLVVTAGTGIVTFGNAVGGGTALANLAVTGTTVLRGNVSTEGAQTFHSAVTLSAASVTLNSDANGTGNGPVDFASTVDATTAGQQGLTVTAGIGAVTFGGAVGGSHALASLAVTGPTTLDSNVSTDGAQTYNSAVTLNAGSVTLHSNVNGTANGAVDFVSTVDATAAGGQGLIVDAGTGPVTFGNAVGGSQALASLAVTGPTVLDGSVFTEGTQTYNSAITLGAPLVTLNSNANTTGNGAVDFASTVDATTAGNQGLVVTAGTGIVTFGNTVGGSQALKSLAVTGPTMLGGNVSTEGVQTFNSAVTLTAATVALNSNANGTGNGAVDFASTVDATTAGSQGLTVTTGTGTLTFGNAVGGSQKLASLDATSGAIVLDGDISTAGPLTLDSTGGATLTLPVNLSGSAVTLQSAGAINQTLGVITAGTLFVTSTGGATLGDANQVGELGTSANTGAGGFTVQDGQALTVLGTVAGGTGTLSLTTTSGSISIGTTGTAGVLNAATLALSGAAGISEPDGSIDATTLIGGAGGTVSLLGPTNTIGTLGNFTVTGGTDAFGLVDASALVVSGKVTAPGDVYLASSTATVGAGITIASTGSVGGGALAGFQADNFVNNGTVSATTGEVAPFHSGSLLTIGGAATLGVFNVTNLRFGAVTVPGTLMPVTTAGSIVIQGAVSAPTASVELDSLGGIGEAVGGSLIAGTLTGTAGADVVLLNSGNTIGALGNFGVTGGAFKLTDVGNITVVGSVGGSGVTITAGTIAIGNGTLAGTLNTTGTVLLDATGAGIALNANALLDGAVVDLSSAAGVTEVNTGTVIATSTLQSTSGVIGTVALLSNHNTIGTLGGFVVTTGNLELNDTESLAVTGSVNATNLTLSAAAIGVDNSIIASAGSLGLTATAAGISLNSGGVVNGATVDLSAASGTVTEAASAVLTAGTLVSGLGVQGTVALLNANNTIGTLGAFSVTAGDFQLLDQTSLTIAGAVNAADIFTKIGLAGGTLALGNATTGATLNATAASNPAISLIADNIVEGIAASSITASGGTVAIAPLTNSRVVSLGGSTHNGTLVADGTLLGDLNTGTLRIGSYNDATNGGAATLTAGGISVDGPVNLNGHAATLLLNTSGGIAETGSGTIQVTTLTGTSAGGVTLNNANQVSELAGFVVNNGAGGVFDLAEAASANLDVTGSVLATGVALTGAAVTSINAGITATLGGSIHVSSGDIALGSGALLFVTGPVPGVVDLDSTGGGITESGGGLINAGTLLSSGGSQGNVDFGSANDIGTLGGFVVTGGTFHLDNGGTVANLDVIGSVVAAGVTLDHIAGTLSVNSSIIGTTGTVLLSGGTSSLFDLNPTAVVAGPTIVLNAGSIAMAGAALLGQTGALLDVTTTNGGWSEAATSTIVAGTLQSSVTIGGTVSLIGSNNAVATLASVGVTNSDTFDLLNTGTLNAIGTLTATGITIATTSTFTVAGSLLAGGVVNLAGSSIIINGPAEVSDGGSGTTNLIASGGSIVETGTLIAGTLTGNSTGATSLTGATTITNQLLNLGSFSAGSFVLNDGTALTVAGPVSGGTSATIFDALAITVSGSLFSSNAISLTGSSIAINGSGFVSDGGAGTTSLVANAVNGTIFENGTLIAGTLSGSSNGATSLLGATTTVNQVGTLNGFTAVDFTLNDGQALTVNSVLSAGPTATILDSNLLTVNGSIVSTSAVNLTAGNIAIAGLVTDGGAGTTNLIANAVNGTIFENGTLIAGTLSGSSNGATSLLGATTTVNQVGTLNGFTAVDFTLNDGQALTVNSVLSAGPTATILDSNLLTVNGSIVSTSAVNLTAGNIAIAGLVTDGGAGATSLIANAVNGTISENGTLIAGTLSGSSNGATSLLGATTTVNQVGTLNGFTAVDFTLNDGQALTVNSVLSAGPTATILDGNLLTVNGSIISTSAVNLTAGNIAIPGLVTDGGAGTTSLIANAVNGTIFENGTLIAGTLSGSSNGATSLLGATTTINQVGTLNGFSAVDFTLNDGHALTVNSVLSAGPTATILDSNLLTVNGSIVSTSAVNLTAGNIAIAGLVTDGGAGTTNLIANAVNGTIFENGTLIAGTLSGSSNGATSLLGATTTVNQVGTLNGFTAVDFTLNDGQALTVNGVLSAGPTATILDSNLLTVNGSIVSTSAVNLTAGNIAIAGLVTDGGTGTTSLIANAVNGTIFENGTLIAGTLSGSSKGATTLTGATTTVNQVGTLNGFTAVDFTLNDGQALTVNSVLSAGPTATILDSNLLTVNGSIVSTSAVNLTAGNIAIAGLVTDGGAGTTSLVANAVNGTIFENGTLIAGTLSGSSNGATSLLGATTTVNQVGTLNGFTAVDFTLNDGQALTVNSVLSAGPTATILDSNLLTVNGSIVSTSAVNLTAGNIAIAGLVTDGGAGTTNLIANAVNGTIFENGTLIAGTLSGSSNGATSLLGATTTVNQVGTLNGFTAVDFTLNDGQALTVNSVLSAGPTATILDSNLLTVNGSIVSTSAVNLTAGNIAIAGLVTDGGAGATSLIANAVNGTISENGTLIAGTLSGSSNGATSLLGATTTVNQVGTLNGFTAVDFTLNDGQALTVNSVLSAGPTATILDGNLLTVNGSIISTSAVNLTAGNIAIPGLVTDGGAGTTSLIANAVNGTIFENGTLIAGTLSGSSNGATSLLGATTTINQVGTLNGFSAVDFTLNDGHALTVNSVLSAGPTATILDSNLLTVNGSIVSTSAVNLTAGNIAIAGLVTDGGAGTTNLIANAVNGTIFENGTLIAGTLSGSSNGATSLLGATTTVNQVGTLNGFTAVDFTLNDGQALTVNGVLSAGPTATILDSNLLTVNGSIVSTSAVNLTAGNIAIAGLVTDGGTGTTSLIANAVNGTIFENGTLIAGTLSGSSKGATTLTGATTTVNQVGTLNGFTAVDFTLNDGQALTVNSVLSAGPTATILDSNLLTVNGSIVSTSAVNLTAGNIAIAGLVTDGGAGTTNLIANAVNGTIFENGTLIAGTLSGSSNGATSLLGATTTVNQVGTLNGFTAVDFTLNDGQALTVNSVLSAGPTATILDSNLLTVNGSIVSTSAVNLTAGNIAIAGLVTDGGAGATSLIANAVNGTISENGTLIAGTLSGSSNGATSLLGATAAINQVGTLNGFSATAFTLNDGASLTVIAPVIGNPGSVAITTQGTLTNNSTITAGTSETLLANGNLTNNGSAIAQSSDASLTSTIGTLTNNGLIEAGANVVLAADTGLTNSNTGSVIAQTGFGSLTASAGPLANSGLIQADTNVTMLGDTNLTNTGSVVAQTGFASLTASTGTLFNSGLIEAGTNVTLGADTGLTNSNTGSVIAQSGFGSLTAAAGTLSNAGLIKADTNVVLLGDTGLTNIGSVIAQTGFGSLTASTGTLFNSNLIEASTNETLLGQAGLTNTGSVIAQSGFGALTASAGALSNSGLIKAGSSETLQGQTGLTNTGSVIAQGSFASLTASAGALSNGGLIEAGSSETLLGQTGLTNTGSVIAQGSFASLTAAAGPLSNSGLIKADTNVTLLGATGLTNSSTGSVIAQTGFGSLTASTGMLTNNGLVEAGSSETLLGASLANTGSVIAQASFASLTTSAGPLSNSGLIKADTSVTMLGDTGLTNSGSVIAQTSSASLTAPAGALSNSGLIEADTSVTLVGDTGLTNTGSVIAQTGSASLTASAGALSNSGLIEASTDATLLGAAGLSNTGSVIAQAGNTTLTATAGTLFTSGLVSAPAANAIVALNALNGSLNQPGGSIIAGGSVVMNISGDITLNGLVKDDTGVTLNTGGAITENGTLIADLLTGSAAGSVSLLGATATTNQVAILGKFTSGGSFILRDGMNLLIDGVVSAPMINILDGVDTISLGNGGFITSGAVRPTGAIMAQDLPPFGITTLGAYLYAGSVIQTGGAFTVSNLPGTQESILGITLAPGGAGTLQFNAGGLIAPTTWLIVSVSNGEAGGPINVAALDFEFAPPPGRADFTGTINGLSGPAAAGAAFIQPQQNSNFRIDGCPIHSVNCVLLATQGVPTTNPTNEINLGAPLNQENPEDLVLPVVSDERYELVPCSDTDANGCPTDSKNTETH